MYIHSRIALILSKFIRQIFKSSESVKFTLLAKILCHTECMCAHVLLPESAASIYMLHVTQVTGYTTLLMSKGLLIEHILSASAEEFHNAF